MTEGLPPQERPGDPAFAGRIDILYALGRHYHSLPFKSHSPLCRLPFVSREHAAGKLRGVTRPKQMDQIRARR